MTRPQTGPGETDVAIVGAGFAGLAMALELQARDRHDFVVLERADQPGGTWRDNVYPGVACDVPAPLYSLARRPHSQWSREYAPGAEIQDYLRGVAAEPALASHMRYGTGLTAARWSADDQRWHLDTTTGPLRCRVLVMCAGRLTEPRLPAIAGLDSFPGVVVHSARWRKDITVTGLRVGLVGSGASALQLAPALARDSASLVVFQRSAPWVLDRPEREYSDVDRTRLADPAGHALARSTLYDHQESLFDGRISASDSLQTLRDSASAHLSRSVRDPRLRAQLTPADAPGCRRLVFSHSYYGLLDSGAIRLEPSALGEVAGSTAFGESGTGYELDLLVLATGFETREQPYARIVTGRRGTTLAERWSTGLHAVGSVAIPEFPNMFVINGPQATLAHNSSLLTIEAQVDVVTQALTDMDHRHGVLEATELAARRDRDALLERTSRTVWASGCQSWYLNRDGSPGLLWPGTLDEFRATYGHFSHDDYQLVPTPLETR